MAVGRAVRQLYSARLIKNLGAEIYGFVAAEKPLCGQLLGQADRFRTEKLRRR